MRAITIYPTIYNSRTGSGDFEALIGVNPRTRLFIYNENFVEYANGSQDRDGRNGLLRFYRKDVRQLAGNAQNGHSLGIPIGFLDDNDHDNLTNTPISFTNGALQVLPSANSTPDSLFKTSLQNIYSYLIDHPEITEVFYSTTDDENNNKFKNLGIELFAEKKWTQTNITKINKHFKSLFTELGKTMTIQYRTGNPTETLQSLTSDARANAKNNEDIDELVAIPPISQNDILLSTITPFFPEVDEESHVPDMPDIHAINLGGIYFMLDETESIMGIAESKNELDRLIDEMEPNATENRKKQILYLFATYLPFPAPMLDGLYGDKDKNDLIGIIRTLIQHLTDQRLKLADQPLYASRFLSMIGPLSTLIDDIEKVDVSELNEMRDFLDGLSNKQIFMLLTRISWYLMHKDAIIKSDKATMWAALLKSIKKLELEDAIDSLNGIDKKDVSDYPALSLSIVEATPSNSVSEPETHIDALGTALMQRSEEKGDEDEKKGEEDEKKGEDEKGDEKKDEDEKKEEDEKKGEEDEKKGEEDEKKDEDEKKVQEGGGSDIQFQWSNSITLYSIKQYIDTLEGKKGDKDELYHLLAPMFESLFISYGHSTSEFIKKDRTILPSLLPFCKLAYITLALRYRNISRKDTLYAIKGVDSVLLQYIETQTRRLQRHTDVVHGSRTPTIYFIIDGDNATIKNKDRNSYSKLYLLVTYHPGQTVYSDLESYSIDFKKIRHLDEHRMPEWIQSKSLKSLTFTDSEHMTDTLFQLLFLRAVQHIHPANTF